MDKNVLLGIIFFFNSRIFYLWYFVNIFFWGDCDGGLENIIIYYVGPFPRTRLVI